MNKIEKILHEKTKGTSLEILHAHWCLTKNHVPSLLSAISQVFPHYSLHDISHSEAIISCITMIVGVETLEKFSAIDLWFLLCVSYCHDLGMYVEGNEITECFTSLDFIGPIQDIKNNKESPLNKYTEHLEINGQTIDNIKHQLTGENYNNVKFLIADYIRKNHGQRASVVIENQSLFHLLGNPIPERIKDLIAKMCLTHTLTFEDVMKLPKEEAGIGDEACHPRFIACLLRLGDLLDMDNHRFSDVLLGTLPYIPEESFNHRDKHLSIKRLRIDQERIEAKAYCEESGIAKLTNDWFILIKDEMSKFCTKWNDIVPYAFFTRLPTLGNLDVVLERDEVFDGKKSWEFAVDVPKVLTLLQGTGLYEDKFACIRELIQNAEDATYLRIFLDHENEIEDTQEGFAQFIEWCREYPISIKLEKTNNTDPDKVEWEFSLEDKGLGMSKEDLQYLCIVGSSSRNQEKNNIVYKMPEWMRPSGVFSIGFQSVFLLTDEVEITTRKKDSGEAYSVEMFNPKIQSRRNIRIKLEVDNKINVGTTVKFKFYSDRYPEPSLTQNGLLQLNKFDFIKEDSLDVDEVEIINKILENSEMNYIPVNLFKAKSSDKFNVWEKNRSDNFYFCREKNIDLCIGFFDRYCYRNKKISKNIPNSLKFLDYNVNILSGKAIDILEVNRDSFLNSYLPKLERDIIDALFIYINHKFDSEQDPNIKERMSMFVNYYKDESEYYSLFKNSNDILSQWENVEIKIKSLNKFIKMGDLARNVDECIFCRANKNSREHNDNSIADFSEGKLIIELKKFDEIISNISDDAFSFLLAKLCENGCGHISWQYSEKYGDTIVLSKEKKDRIIDWDACFDLYQIENSISVRSMIPCNEKYKELAQDKNHSFPLSEFFIFPINIPHYPYDQMICPYIREYFVRNTRELMRYLNTATLKWSCPDELIDKAFENRADKSVTRDQIIEAYEKFREEVQPLVDEVNQYPLAGIFKQMCATKDSLLRKEKFKSLCRPEFKHILMKSFNKALSEFIKKTPDTELEKTLRAEFEEVFNQLTLTN